jgi:hypothetical protein
MIKRMVNPSLKVKNFVVLMGSINVFFFRLQRLLVLRARPCYVESDMTGQFYGVLGHSQGLCVCVCVCVCGRMMESQEHIFV